MTAQSTSFGRAKSGSGAALVAIGMFILYQHLDRAAGHLSHFLCNNHGDTPGPLPAIIMAAACVTQAYAADHHGILQVLVKQLVLSFWPLLLVMVGSMLSRDAFKDAINTAQKKDCGLVDLAASRSTSK
jgi:hypothetical protein